ncbi:MAG: glycosyltransferase family 4 protein [Phycisphaerae bacterium]
MLGWEFPPFISGGLGTACHGLTRAMTEMGVEILFVLPTASDAGQQWHSGHVPSARRLHRRLVRFMSVPCAFRSPYGTGRWRESKLSRKIPVGSPEACSRLLRVVGTGAAGGYEGNLILRIAEYADHCVKMTVDEPFDLIHAHDWVTFPAGRAVARRHGRPLVVHVHSTEFDRSGEEVNQAVYDIEREGMREADCVIAVSNLTKDIVVNRYGINADKVRVIHNGIARRQFVPSPGAGRRGKMVLFLGRLTMQKGPEFFVRAARRVLEKVPDARFVIAGWGDLGPRIIEQVVAMGLGQKIQFTGFLRGREVDQAYCAADVYVMPSVSEPFGLTALEAIQHGVPVVLSRNSGVAEVLSHGALKCDYWDVDVMADRIIAILTRPELAEAMRDGGAAEVRALTWDAAAQKCLGVYNETIGLAAGQDVEELMASGV